VGINSTAYSEGSNYPGKEKLEECLGEGFSGSAGLGFSERRNEQSKREQVAGVRGAA